MRVRRAFTPIFRSLPAPDTGQSLERKGFIGVGAVEEYAAGIIHRHEHTLSGPRKDRMELLRHTHAHFGQIFMLYPDPELAIDQILDKAAAGEAADRRSRRIRRDASVWKISDPAAIARIQALMADKKLLIADGHHRYETALAFRNENPRPEGCGESHDDFREHAFAGPGDSGDASDV